MTDISRRGFLTRSGSMLAIGTAATTLDADNATAGSGTSTPQGPQKNYTLTAQWIKTSLGDTQVKLRTWNGTVPGTMIVAEPGDTLNVDIVNNLTPYDSSAWAGNHNVPHDLNSTNLHVHGLEVQPHLFEPLGTADPHAPMISIPPEGGTKSYRFDIPIDQPPGLFWYHPHKHGSTAVQAVSGMAGGILIKGNIDQVPEIAAATDNIMVIQDIGLFPTDNPELDGADTYTYEPTQNAIWQTYQGLVTIDDEPQAHLNSGFTTGDYPIRYFLMNGEPFFKEVHNSEKPDSPIGTQMDVPTYTMAQGEVARFRMLNANSDDVMPIYLQDHDLHLIGMDGVNLPKLRTLPALPSTAKDTDYQLLMAPANRCEYLVKANAKPGTYELRQSPQELQFLVSEGRVLAKIVITGETNDMALPAELPIQTRHFPFIPDAEVINTRIIEFGMQFPGVANKVVGLDFFINNQLYEELSVPNTVILNTAEDWIIKSPPHPDGPSSAHAAHHFDNTEGHPFHIHVNSFEVIAMADVDANGVASNEVRFTPDEILIQDTIWVPMGKQVTIRQKYKQWTGKAVYHCHILPHEDTGMMQNLLILDSNLVPGHGSHK
jgi:FtsP/CotA-like multicopper oxidase with cupredoxin domain